VKKNVGTQVARAGLSTQWVPGKCDQSTKAGRLTAQEPAPKTVRNPVEVESWVGQGQSAGLGT
jgi:hypothetical protein